MFGAVLRLPRADPENNVLVAVRGDEIAGYVRLDPELNIGRVVAWIRTGHGAPDEVPAALVEAAMERATELGVREMHVPVEPASANPYAGVLQRAGMRVVRRYRRMYRSTTPHEVPAIPEGLMDRPFEPGVDEPNLTELQNAVFTGNWGYSPNTVEEVSARLALPGHDAAGVLFLEGSSGPVAYCWTSLDRLQRPATGVICMMGVHPAHRGRKLGQLVTSLGIRLLSTRGAGAVTLEVDRANDAAVELYGGLGFERGDDVVWYERLIGAQGDRPNVQPTA